MTMCGRSGQLAKETKDAQMNTGAWQSNKNGG
jgi:hypothetical protein